MSSIVCVPANCMTRFKSFSKYSNTGRPYATISAPLTSAVRMFSPQRKPLSNTIGTRTATASEISSNISNELAHH